MTRRGGCHHGDGTGDSARAAAVARSVCVR